MTREMFPLILFCYSYQCFCSSFFFFFIFFLYSLSFPVFTALANVFVLLSNMLICPSIVCLFLIYASLLAWTFAFFFLIFATFLYEVLMYLIARVFIMMIKINHLFTVAVTAPTPSLPILYFTLIFLKKTTYR